MRSRTRKGGNHTTTADSSETATLNEVMLAVEFLGLVYFLVVIAALQSLIIWLEETIYRRLFQIKSFLELVLLYRIRPLIASGMFGSPIPCQNNFPFFLFFSSLFGTRGSSIAFAFFPKTWQQRENNVAWSGRDGIACRNKDGM